MMPSARYHEMLDELLSGKLSPEQTESYARVLETSQWFTDLASRIAPKEELLNLVRTQVMTEGMPDARAQSLMSQLRALYQPTERVDQTMIQGTHETLVHSHSSKYDFLTPPQASDEIGRMEGYRVLQILGEGGMGSVFMVEDLKLKRKLALKAMKPEIAAVEIHRMRFMREAQTVAQLDHDNIVQIFHVGEEKGVPFITMPLLKGESLEDRLKKETPMSMRDVIRFGRQMAEGLMAAHERGVIHRDMKPANVWIEMPKERVKILDFGLARNAVGDLQLTMSGAVMGTPAYMAPEQTRGEKVDHRADLYSLGVMLYQMSTGTRQYKGADLVFLLRSLAGPTPPEPRNLNPEVPALLNKLVVELMNKDAGKRVQTAEEVANRLRSMEDAPTDRCAPKLKLVPLANSVETAPCLEAKKSKTGLIVGIVIALAVLGVGVVFLLK